MNRLELEQKVISLENTLEKAVNIANDLEDDYSIFNTAEPSEKDKLLYSLECGRICNYIIILKDYVEESKKQLKELKEAYNL
ncbi:MAG: hypothetical protein NC548_22430 [Lachnospiraceae bacterium]|nr:hypothetical protein [Lachnospiraceae bacterium]